MNVATLNPGTPVTLSALIGPNVKTRPAIFLGSTGNSFTVQTDDPIHPVRSIRWDSETVWISDPATGIAYAPADEDPVLASTIADRE